MAKLGSHKHPAIARVQTMERAQEIVELCNEHDWQVIVGIEPDKPEDIADVNKLLNQAGERDPAERQGGILSGLKNFVSPPPTEPELPQVGRNEPCPCGSGKKYKQCCMKKKSGH